MITIRKTHIRTIRLNSFHPLCMNAIGMRAITQYGFAPFIDHSCRREPDFENPNPSITSLCRQDKFAPNLHVNDIVVYITTKDNWFTNDPHYRLIAILSVIDHRNSHYSATTWYRTNNINLPSNCMVASNPPHQFHETAGNYTLSSEIDRYLNRDAKKQDIVGQNRIKYWDAEYLAKSKKWGDFIITKPLFVDVNNPPILTIQDMTNIFGKVPNTRNPNIINKEQLKKLATYAGLDLILE